MVHTKSASCAGPRHRLSLATLLAVVLLTGLMPGQAIEEYQLKAAVIFNLAKFVEWPPNTFGSLSDPIVSCVLGDSPFGRSLDRELNGRVIEGRQFTVRRISEIRQASGCQILIITTSEHKRWRSTLDGYRTKGTLTVGETDGFASDGGVANLKLEAGKVRIEINLEAADQEGLRISSRLLSLAQIVKR